MMDDYISSPIIFQALQKCIQKKSVFSNNLIPKEASVNGQFGVYPLTQTHTHITCYVSCLFEIALCALFQFACVNSLILHRYFLDQYKWI